MGRNIVVRQGVLGVGVVLVAAGLLGGCSSANGSTTAKPAIQATCQQINGVLSTGPDPDTDPVGYAEAQVLPLRHIHTSDGSLQRAVDQLATAYQHFYLANGSGRTVTRAVSNADRKVDAICPGATS
jgi:hypothetical protein